MSIFNGHEDESAEELAQKFGISDLAVVENAGRKTKNILEEPISKKSVLKGVTIKDIDQLTDGNIVIYKGKVGTIVNQNFARELTLVKRGEGIETEYFLGDLIKTHKHLGIGVKSIKTGKWMNSAEISPEEGMKVKCIDGNIGKITNITTDKFITVKRDAGGKIRYHKKLPVTHQVYQENSQFKNYEWTKNYDVSLLKKGMTVKIYDVLIGTIDKIHKNTINISFSNGTSESFSIESFQKDVEVNINVEVNCFEDLKVGDLIKKRNGSDIYKFVDIIQGEEIIIQNLDDSNAIDTNLFYKNFKKERRKINPLEAKYQALELRKSKKNNPIWCDNFKFDDFKKGMTICIKDKTRNILGNIVTINDSDKSIEVLGLNGKSKTILFEEDIPNLRIDITVNVSYLDDLYDGMYVKEKLTGRVTKIKLVFYQDNRIVIEGSNNLPTTNTRFELFQNEWIALTKKP